MLASPIFHHSHHIRLSLSLSSSPSSPSYLFQTHTHIHAFGVTSSLFLRSLGSLFSATTLSFSHARHPSFTRGISHLYSVKTLVSSFIPAQSSRFLSPSPVANIFSRFLDPSQSRTRNLIQNVPNAIHIIILVADNGKFV